MQLIRARAIELMDEVVPWSTWYHIKIMSNLIDESLFDTITGAFILFYEQLMHSQVGRYVGTYI